MTITTFMICDHCGKKFHNLDGSSWQNTWWFCWTCFKTCTGR